MGRPASTPRHFWSRIRKTKTCWLFPADPTLKYGLLRYQGGMWRAHRLSWTLRKGKIPRGKNVLHKCDVRNCVRPSHLFLGTHAQNVADKCRKNRQARGVRNGTSKLTDQKIVRIFLLRERGMTMNEIGKQFEISGRQVSNILHRRQWKHVPKLRKIFRG